jgi:hypothetical protein
MQKLRLLSLVLFTCVVSPHTSAQADAPQMVYVELRFLSPKITPGTFASTVRKVWRSSDRYLRIEEAPDPQQHIHGVIIVNEPDVWMWNRFDNTAKHMVDSGPTYVAHAPLFSGERSKPLRALEIGREKEFFAAKKANPLPDETVDGVECTARSLTVDDSTVTLYLRKSDDSPLQVTLMNPRDAYAVRYEKYEAGLPLTPSLFVAPREAKIIESN